MEKPSTDIEGVEQQAASRNLASFHLADVVPSLYTWSDATNTFTTLKRILLEVWIDKSFWKALYSLVRCPRAMKAIGNTKMISWDDERRLELVGTVSERRCRTKVIIVSAASMMHWFEDSQWVIYQWPNSIIFHKPVQTCWIATTTTATYQNVATSKRWRHNFRQITQTKIAWF